MLVAWPVNARARAFSRWGNNKTRVCSMKTSVLKYAMPLVLSLGLCQGAEAAPAQRSLCLMFCGGKTAAPERAQKADAAVPNGPPADLDAAIAQAQTARKSGDLAGSTRILSQLVPFAPDDPRVL